MIYSALCCLLNDLVDFRISAGAFIRASDLLDRLAGASGSQLLRSLCVQPRYGAAQTQTFGSYDAAVTRSEGLAEDAGVELINTLIRQGCQTIVTRIVRWHCLRVQDLLNLVRFRVERNFALIYYAVELVHDHVVKHFAEMV